MEHIPANVGHCRACVSLGWTLNCVVVRTKPGPVPLFVATTGVLRVACLLDKVRTIKESSCFELRIRSDSCEDMSLVRTENAVVANVNAVNRFLAHEWASSVSWRSMGSLRL